MERAVAIKKLTKILGKSLGYRVDPRAPTKDQREAAREELAVVCANRERLEKEKNERSRAILAADPEYQRLKAEYETTAERGKRLMSIAMHYKITVGVSSSLFFHVKAEGDSWEDVIAKLQK